MNDVLFIKDLQRELAEAKAAVREKDEIAMQLQAALVALRKSEAWLTASFESMPAGVAVVDMKGAAVISNTEYRRLLPNSSIPSRAPSHGVHWRAWDEKGLPVDPQDFPGSRALRGERVMPGQEMLRRDDQGLETWVRVATVPIEDVAGQVTGVVTVISDIDGMKRSAEALRDSEARFAQFAASSSDALWIRDAATLEMEYVSPAIQAIYGVPPEALLDGTGNWTALILPEDRDTALAHLEQGKAGDAVVHEFRIRRRSDGRIRWIRNTDFPLRDAHGHVQRIGGIAKDVTDIKATEAALTHSEHRLRTLVEGIPLLVWRAIDGGDWTWASPQWTHYTGQAEPDSHHLGWLEPIHPKDQDRALSAWDHALLTGGFEVEYRIRQASDGAYRWFQTRATPVRNTDGEIMEWLGTSTDVQELKILQEKQAVMVAELQHRTRNLIGVVRAIAEDTMEQTGPTETFRAAFADRLSALARVQGLLSRSDMEPITIGALVALELDALGADARGKRTVVTGPDVVLRPSSVQTLALALHELATNARKYGALSHDQGHLAVTWRERIEADEARLALDWVETGLECAPARPAGSTPSGGYGRELIEQALPHALGARTSYVLTRSGLRCTVDMPIRSGQQRSEL